PGHRSISTFDFRLSAFSMVELLIAIMILGLGLVMVATIFPVGLDMTRETVEKGISLAAADYAVDLIKLKVPTWHDEIANSSRNNYLQPSPVPPPTNMPVVLLPTTLVMTSDPYSLLRSGTPTPLAPVELGMENDAVLESSNQRLSSRSSRERPFVP